MKVLPCHTKEFELTGSVDHCLSLLASSGISETSYLPLIHKATLLSPQVVPDIPTFLGPASVSETTLHTQSGTHTSPFEMHGHRICYLVRNGCAFDPERRWPGHIHFTLLEPVPFLCFTVRIMWPNFGLDQLGFIQTA